MMMQKLVRAAGGSNTSPHLQMEEAFADFRSLQTDNRSDMMRRAAEALIWGGQTDSEEGIAAGNETCYRRHGSDREVSIDAMYRRNGSITMGHRLNAGIVGQTLQQITAAVASGARQIKGPAAFVGLLENGAAAEVYDDGAISRTLQQQRRAWDLVKYQHDNPNSMLFTYQEPDTGRELMASVLPSADHIVVRYVDDKDRIVRINIEDDESVRASHLRLRAEQEQEAIAKWQRLEPQHHSSPAAGATRRIANEPYKAPRPPYRPPEPDYDALIARLDPADVHKERQRVLDSYGDDDDDLEMIQAHAEQAVRYLAYETWKTEQRARDMERWGCGRGGC